MSTEEQVFPVDWDIPAEIREQVGSFASRQRELHAQGHLVLVFHQLPTPGDPTRLSVLVWRSPDGNWRAIIERPGSAENEICAAEKAMASLLQSYEDRIDALEKQYREATDAKQLFESLRQTIPVLRSMKNLSATLQAAREHFPKVKHLLIWREEAHGLERAVDLLFEEARAALDFANAEQAEVQSQANLEMARAAHRLNLIVIIFLPLTAIASAFGMNIVSGLEDTGPWLFWSIIALAIVSGVTARQLISRNRPPLEAVRGKVRKRQRH